MLLMVLFYTSVCSSGDIYQSTTLFTEKDNLGSRIETAYESRNYFLTRKSDEPFLDYVFDREKDARNALLSLECIHDINKTDKLICTETLNFGYYRNKEAQYEVIISGPDLSYELWTIAKNSFAKNSGRYKNDFKPKKINSKSSNDSEEGPQKVTFIREDREQRMGHTFVYRIYKGLDAVSAKAFLKEKPVNKSLYYIVVETPEGNYCRDIKGMYKE